MVDAMLPLPKWIFNESRPEFGHLTQRLREFLRRDRGGDMEDNADLAHQLMLDAVRARATDIHLQPESGGLRIRFRIDGILHDTAVLSHEQGERLLRRFKALAGIDPVSMTKPVDGRAVYELEDRKLHLRIATVPSVCGEALAVRILDPALPRRGLADLGLSSLDREIVDHWLADISGMFLVVGPAGSGKTTTLYALLEQLRLSSGNVITLENPVEYQIDGITQVNLSEQHDLDPTEGLKMLLRLDPDHILLGEIRDAASAQTAAQAAASGRTILSTLHSRDTVGAITTLRNYGLADHEIVAALEMIVAQRLIRKLCPHCRRQGVPSDAEKAWLARLGYPAPAETWQAVGCAECQQTGYLGRTGVFEVWRLDSATTQAILAHVDEIALRQQRRQRGGRCLLDDALEKAAQGITTLAEVQTLGGQGHVLSSL
jgi:general secretion pathway protein E